MWSDGQPITSEDFKYTWDQIANGKDIYDKTGYDKIESVDSTQPEDRGRHVQGAVRLVDRACSVAASTASSRRTSSQGKDRAKAMKNGYDWSGGPWIGKWHNGVDVTLTPNPNWYGTKPKLDKVIFKFIPDTAAEFRRSSPVRSRRSTRSPQLDAVDAIKDGLPDSQKDITTETPATSRRCG